MRYCYFLFIIFILNVSASFAQTNIISTNPLALDILKGNYDPQLYNVSNPVSNPEDLVKLINDNISPDSLKLLLQELVSFQNRNTGSDTVSANRGIGAARRWAFDKFVSYSQNSNNRLIPSYLQFDQFICFIGQHRNIFAVLPGTDTSDKSVIIIEGHIDSRCAGVCDVNCDAHGAEDNGSGTVLVMELARVMSKYAFKHTIVFLLTIGEEQGLHGANAFATYAVNNNIAIKAVLNNDVIGGIICGKTSSEPSCPGLNDIDSTGVRIFSAGTTDSPNKGLARFVKLEYEESLKPYVQVPMDIRIMTPEDRTGRGGDHIPFRQKGFAAIRFTAANEHGDASHGAGYDDRQHTTEDVLGVDTNNDGFIDSFFVDFNYLSRNTAINGMTATLASEGPETPSFTMVKDNGMMKININSAINYPAYRIGVRTLDNYWDTVYTVTSKQNITIPFHALALHFVSVASVDNYGIESFFSNELFSIDVGVKEDPELRSISLLQNRPNPFDEATVIGVLSKGMYLGKTAIISVRDVEGKLIKSIELVIKDGLNEVIYGHGYGITGTYFYTLTIEGKVIDTKRMVFAN